MMALWLIHSCLHFTVVQSRSGNDRRDAWINEGNGSAGKLYTLHMRVSMIPLLKSCPVLDVPHRRHCLPRSLVCSNGQGQGALRSQDKGTARILDSADTYIFPVLPRHVGLPANAALEVVLCRIITLLGLSHSLYSSLPALHPDT